MKRHRPVMIAALAAACGLPITALGQSARLWSERGSKAPALAQVPDFRTLASQVVPAVVSLQVEQRAQSTEGLEEPFDFFHRYFGGDIPREYHNRGLGTGFVIDASGLILTNFHVVEEATSIEVTFTDSGGTERKVMAKVLGKAEEYDVALLQTEEPVKVAIAYLGDSNSVFIGDWVMAIGNPFGLSHSVSVGIISAKERRDISPSGRRGLYNFLQTDASINPGNSGGPLVNMRGEVIGINSAINAAGSGIGFAIPINMVKDMLPELRTKGRYTRSWIGIKIQPLTADLAQTYGLRSTSGALVSEVVPKSPAATADLREGDVILEFDGKLLQSSTDLPLFASMAGVGRRVPVRVWREGTEVLLQVTLTEFPSQPAAPASAAPASSSELGLVVADITPALQRELALEVSRGVVAKDVEPGGAAARAGLLRGDIVLTVNGQEVTSARAFADTVRGAKPGALLRLKVSRQHSNLFVALRKP